MVVLFGVPSRCFIQQPHGLNWRQRIRLAAADGVQHLAPRIAEERLPADVVEAVVEGNEHGHESLTEDPALVARVERLAGALFELGDDGLV